MKKPEHFMEWVAIGSAGALIAAANIFMFLT
jgi:hypothetical protein